MTARTRAHNNCNNCEQTNCHSNTSKYVQIHDDYAEVDVFSCDIDVGDNHIAQSGSYPFISDAGVLVLELDFKEACACSSCFP